MGMEEYHYLRLGIVIFISAFFIIPAYADLQLIQPDPNVGATFFGTGGYSADGLGQIGTGGTIQAEVPTGSTVEQAYLYTATFNGVALTSLNFDGTVVALSELTNNQAPSFLKVARADVTTQVVTKVGGGSGTPFDFVINSDPSGLDGVALVVIFSNPSLPNTSIAVLDGGLSSAASVTNVNFVSPIDKTITGFSAIMSLGISFSAQDQSGLGGLNHCGGESVMDTQVDINLASLGAVAARLTSCAGNIDDGVGTVSNGILITVGGVGDNLANPSDPTQRPGEGATSEAIEDDELYNIASFITQGDTSMTINTINTSNDDLVFLSIIAITAEAAFVNTPPTATPQTVNTNEDTDAIITLTGADVELSDLSFSIVSVPATGTGNLFQTLNGVDPTDLITATLVTNGDNKVIYVPPPNENGSPFTSFTFTASDGELISDPATVTINVLSVNDEPTLNAIANPAAIDEDEPLEQTIGFSGITAGAANEEAGQTTNVSVLSDNPTLIGALTKVYTPDAASGSVKYTAQPNQHGTAIITVTVNDGGGTANGGDEEVSRTFTVTVNSVNDEPTLNAITNPAAIPEDTITAQVVNLAGIGSGAANEAQTLVVTAVSSDTNRLPNPTVSYTSPNAEGSISYIPVANANGDVTVTVTVNDGGGIANGGDEEVSRTFTVSITAVNDNPTANNESIDQSISEDETDNANLTDELIAAVVDVDLDPDLNKPVTEVITISAVETPNAAKGLLTFSSVLYKPNEAFENLADGETELDTFSYTAKDQGDQTSTALATVTIDGKNDGPTATANSYTTDEDTSKLGNVITDNTTSGVDSDPDTSDDLEVTEINGAAFTPGTPFALPSGATLTMATNGAFTYDPSTSASFNALAVLEDGNDSFTYKVQDRSTVLPDLTLHGTSSTATVSFTINGVNDAPTANDDPEPPRLLAYDAANHPTFSNSVIVSNPSLALLDNDTDPDRNGIPPDDSLTATVLSGTIDLTNLTGVTIDDPTTGTFTTTAVPGFAGETTFDYEASDGNGGTDIATVTVSFYTVDLSFDTVGPEGDIYVDIIDAFADDPLIGGESVSFKLRSVNEEGDTPGIGQTFTATEVPNTDGKFQAHIVPSRLANPTLPVTAQKLFTSPDDNNEDIMRVSYRDIIDADSATITPAIGEGLSATLTDPLRWDSDIYELGDSATLTIFDLAFDGGPTEGSIQAWVRTTTDPVGLLLDVVEDESNDGHLTGENQVTFRFGGPSDRINFILKADENDKLEASTITRLFSWELDDDLDGTTDTFSAPFGGQGDYPVVGRWDNTGAPGDQIGIFRQANTLWALDISGDQAFTLPADGAGLHTGLGTSTSIPVVADWNGDGDDTIATYDPTTGIWEIDDDGDGVSDRETLPFGGITDVPVAGDWDGVAGAEIGIYRPANGLWALDSNSNDVLDFGTDVLTTGFGGQGSIPVIGNWNPAHAGDEVGVFNPETGEWLLDESGDGNSDVTVPPFGGVGDIPIVGDWDGDGKSDIGIYRPANGLWALDDNGNRAFEFGTDALFVGFGGPGDIPVVGDWDNDGVDGVGIILPAAGTVIVDIIEPSNDQTVEGADFDPTIRITCDDDDDLDGICDEWIPSSTGISFSVAGTTHTRACGPLLVDNGSPSYTTGASIDSTLLTTSVCPVNDRKQMFYEVDYMTGHKPDQNAIEQVIIAFRDSPINNIDSTTGIDLFVTVDEDFGFHSILVPFSGTTAIPGFDEFKVDHFGTVAERGLPDSGAFLTGKFQYTRYMEYLHQLTDSPTASGYAEIGGNDVAITLGAFAGGVGSTEQQAGTTLHEIGHNIFLNHGGAFDNDINCKPNYLSVMNYLFQFEDTLTGRPFDFSHQKLADLVETNLDENVGITLSVHPTEGILNTVVGPESTSPSSTLIETATGQAVDYNRNTDSTDTGVSANINFFDSIGGDCISTDLTTLVGHNDWSNIKLPFRDEATFADGLHTKVDNLGELDVEILTTIIQAIQSEQILAIFTALNALVEDDLVGSLTLVVPILADLSTIDGLINPISPTEPNFSLALDKLVQLRVDIDALPFVTESPNAKETEILALVSTAINILDIVVNGSEDTDHRTPTANSQLNVIDNLDPFVTTLTGSDPNGDPLVFTITDPPGFGTLGALIAVDDTSVTVEYTPNLTAPLFVKTDSYQFEVEDNDTPTPNVSLAATVTIILNNAPTAENQEFIIPEGSDPLTATLTLVAVDDDAGDVLTFVPGDPGSGMLGDVTPVDDRSATVLYTALGGFRGTDSFDVLVSDGFESVTYKVEIIVGEVTVTIFDKFPPKVKSGGGAQSKAAILSDTTGTLSIILDGSTIADILKVNPKGVFFGPAGFEKSGAQGIHIEDDPFDPITDPPTTPHFGDHKSSDDQIVHDGITDLLLHFTMNEINVDPENNDEDGRQLVCLIGYLLPEEGVDETTITEFKGGCLNLTVSSKQSGKSEAPGATDPVALEAILLIQDIQSDIDVLKNDGDVSKQDAKLLTRIIDKAITKLENDDIGSAIKILADFQDTVATIDATNIIKDQLNDAAQDVIDFLLS